jgi:hypothetical protein
MMPGLCSIFYKFRYKKKYRLKHDVGVIVRLQYVPRSIVGHDSRAFLFFLIIFFQKRFVFLSGNLNENAF